MDKLDNLFDAARNQQVEFTYEEVRNSFVAKLNNPKPKKVTRFRQILTFKKLIIMLSSIIFIMLTGYVMFNTESRIHKNQGLSVTGQKHDQTTEDHLNTIQFVEEANSIVPFSRNRAEANSDSIIGFDYIPDRIFVDPLANYTTFAPFQDVIRVPSFKDEPYFPTLTQEEITANHKKKKQMLKALEKFDKKEYVRMPSGTFQYEGREVSLQSFVIQKTEVTNLEYRTFLFDLLIQGRKTEFLIARPDQSQWTKIVGLTSNTVHPMEENYFSHPAYNEYPVVNVSRAGAELYCKWLSQELAKYVDHDRIEQYNDVRLPGRVEWVYAASGTGLVYPYPWKGEFLRDSKGLFLANYKPFSNSYTDDGGFFSVKVDSYNPNSYGLYNMSGNVAEMVYNASNSRTVPGTAGGGWMNNSEEIKILGPDPHSGITDAHPNIGFRVVMTVLNH